MMKQYHEIKEQHQDAIVLFRLGDFYEMFFDDAITASRVLEIALTKRDAGNNQKAAMCGIPHHVSEGYIIRLVESGYKVAICDQLEDPSEAKGIVKRGVTRVLSPGMLISTTQNSKDHNHLLSIYMDSYGVGISYIDIGTGELCTLQKSGTKQGIWSFLKNEVYNIGPSEILIPEHISDAIHSIYREIGIVKPLITMVEYEENLKVAKENTKRYFEDKSVTDKIESYPHSILSTAALLQYVYQYEVQHTLPHIEDIRFINQSVHMEIDANTRINLDIMRNRADQKVEHSLYQILNQTKTPMGHRLLKSWLDYPLMDREEIIFRQNLVDGFINDSELLLDFRESLENVYDMERLIAKLAFRSSNARDLLVLKTSIDSLVSIKQMLSPIGSSYIRRQVVDFDPLDDIRDLINSSILEDAPHTITEGNMIKQGFDAKLDQISKEKYHGSELLLAYENEERERTGIRNLKLIFNKKNGYYIDITKSNLQKVPSHYIKKQTLTNSDRFKTPELMEIEDRLFSSEEEIVKLQLEIYYQLVNEIIQQSHRIKKTIQQLAEWDVLQGFAYTAKTHHYVKPSFGESNNIEIEGGRHPVIEQIIGQNNFISNDTKIGEQDNIIQILTGPNMSGKSTYMRQIALMIIMAHIGSFVPADHFVTPIIDQLFTRIGASDNLASGESTFMVEMKEMVYILSNATPDSFLVLDEVGRGTSTYDGLSIAWAIIEYLSRKVKAKTIFATHYHELTDLEIGFSNIVNYQVEVIENDEDVVFLRKIIPGCSNKSYGIEVAKLAGLPASIIKRSKVLLKSIEESSNIRVHPTKQKPQQVNFDRLQKDAFIHQLTEVAVDRMTPIEALNELSQIINDAKLLKELS